MLGFYHHLTVFSVFFLIAAFAKKIQNDKNNALFN